MMILIATTVVIFAEYGVTLFIRDPETVAFGTQYLRIIALCFPFLGINFVLNFIVRASGAMYQVFILNIISFWVLRYSLTLLFTNSYGEIGIAIGMGSCFIMSSLIAFMYLKFSKWRDKELFN